MLRQSDQARRRLCSDHVFGCEVQGGQRLALHMKLCWNLYDQCVRPGWRSKFRTGSDAAQPLRSAPLLGSPSSTTNKHSKYKHICNIYTYVTTSCQPSWSAAIESASAFFAAKYTAWRWEHLFLRASQFPRMNEVEYTPQTLSCHKQTSHERMNWRRSWRLSTVKHHTAQKLAMWLEMLSKSTRRELYN